MAFPVKRKRDCLSLRYPVTFLYYLPLSFVDTHKNLFVYSSSYKFSYYKQLGKLSHTPRLVCGDQSSSKIEFRQLSILKCWLGHMTAYIFCVAHTQNYLLYKCYLLYSNAMKVLTCYAFWTNI